MLNRDEYRRFINADQPLTNTAAYARIERAPTGTAWRAVCVYHLPAEINNRMLVAFCDVLQGGLWANADKLRIAYTWEGRTEPPLYRPFEKRPPEPRAQVDLYKGQVTTIWVDDPRYPSDRVAGIHSAVENGQGGNTLYHNSFMVFWELRNAVVIPPIDPPTVPGDVAALQAEIARLRGVIASAQNALGAA